MINIDSLIKKSLKSGNKTELQVYRNIKNEFLKEKTSKTFKGDWNDVLEVSIIAKYARSLDAAIADFGGPETLLGSEYSAELEVVKKLLPKPVNESEIHQELAQWQIEQAFKNNWPIELDKPIIPKKEMGNAIKYLKAKFPTADGKLLSEIVKQYLV